MLAIKQIIKTFLIKPPCYAAYKLLANLAQKIYKK